MAGDASELQIGRYRIQQLLGHGGMGDVYLASAQGAAGFAKQVVVKLLRPQGRQVLEMLREAFIGVTLEHANVVSVLDLGEHEGRYYIVMEYVRGFTFGHALDDAQTSGTSLPPSMIGYVVGHVADALDYVHRLGDGIIHRDVSPSNILLGTDGRVKLSDFGVAVAGLDATGDTLVGKPAYLPPECFLGARPTQAWDVYALGVVLWEALAGRRPFVGETLHDLRTAVMSGPPPLARELAPALVEVAERAIDPDPGRRYQHAADLKQAIVAACPPGRLDAELQRRYMRTCFASPPFVARYGLVVGRERTPTPIRIADAPTIDAALPPLRFGLTQAGGSGWARGEGERVAARLVLAIGRPIVAVVLADYRSLIDCLVSGAVDLAWMPPAAYVEAERQGARALVTSSRHGRTTYQSAIITRTDSRFATLADLRGQPIAWVDRDSASGYLFALAELVRVLGDAELLGRQHFVGSHRAACEAVADGWAAAAATYVIVDDDGAIISSGWHERLGARADELRVIAYTRPIPGDNVAGRPGLDPETRKKICAALVALTDDEAGRMILREVFRADALVPELGDIYADVRATIELLRRG